MPIKATATAGPLLISPTDHALVLIDFQSQMSFATKSIDAVMLRNNAALISRAAAGSTLTSFSAIILRSELCHPSGVLRRYESRVMRPESFRVWHAEQFWITA